MTDRIRNRERLEQALAEAQKIQIGQLSSYPSSETLFKNRIDSLYRLKNQEQQKHSKQPKNCSQQIMNNWRNFNSNMGPIQSSQKVQKKYENLFDAYKTKLRSQYQEESLKSPEKKNQSRSSNNPNIIVENKPMQSPQVGANNILLHTFGKKSQQNIQKQQQNKIPIAPIPTNLLSKPQIDIFGRSLTVNNQPQPAPQIKPNAGLFSFDNTFHNDKLPNNGLNIFGSNNKKQNPSNFQKVQQHEVPKVQNSQKKQVVNLFNNKPIQIGQNLANTAQFPGENIRLEAKSNMPLFPQSNIFQNKQPLLINKAETGPKNNAQPERPNNLIASNKNIFSSNSIFEKKNVEDKKLPEENKKFQGFNFNIFKNNAPPAENSSEKKEQQKPVGINIFAPLTQNKNTEQKQNEKNTKNASNSLNLFGISTPENKDQNQKKQQTPNLLFNPFKKIVQQDKREDIKEQNKQPQNEQNKIKVSQNKPSIFSTSENKTNNNSINIFQTNNKAQTQEAKIVPSPSPFANLNSKPNVFTAGDSGSIFAKKPLNPNEKSIFSFSSQNTGGTSLFQASFKKDQEEEEGGQSDEEPLAADQPEIDPSKSTGNYQYEQSQVLFKQVALKLRKGNADTLQQITVSLQKIPNNKNLTIYARLPNKREYFVGNIISNVTEIAYINNNSRNISLKRVVYTNPDGKPVPQTLKIQFKEEKIGQKCYNILKAH